MKRMVLVTLSTSLVLSATLTMTQAGQPAKGEPLVSSAQASEAVSLMNQDIQPLRRRMGTY